MASTYSTNNGIELIGDGEQAGSWGQTTNTNFNLIDESLDGQVSIVLGSVGTSGSPNLLTISDGASSNGRNRVVTFTDGGDLGGTAFVRLDPSDAEKVMIVKNSLSGSRSINLFQGTYSASNDYTLESGKTAIVTFSGSGASSVVTALGVLSTSPLQTSNIGTTVQAWDLNLDQISGLNPGTNSMIVGTGTTWSEKDPDGVKTSLGLVVGTDVQAYDADLTVYGSNPLTAAELQQLQNINATTVSTAQWGYLGGLNGAPLTSSSIGVTVQAYDADLTVFGSNPLTAAELQQLQNINTTTVSTAQWGYLGAASSFGGSLIDDANAAAGRTTLGLGSLATLSTVNNSNWSGTDLAVANGGTGASTVAAAQSALGVGMVFIQSQDASSSATLDFTGFDASLYDAYVFEVLNLIPSADAVLRLRTSSNGGSSYDSGAADYRFVYSRVQMYEGLPTTETSNGDAAAQLIQYTNSPAGSDASEDGWSATFKVYGPHLAKHTRITWEGIDTNVVGDDFKVWGGAVRREQAAVNAIRFFPSSGTFASGTITMYGLRNS